LNTGRDEFTKNTALNLGRVNRSEGSEGAKDHENGQLFSWLAKLKKNPASA
jgi:hypothetical protein